MLNVGLRYAKWFNWRHNKTGHVFGGRYKAVIVDSDEYLLELAAYIHLNPVRVGITTLPEQYRWSSHRAFLGEESLRWLETDFILSQFSTNLNSARKCFAAFVRSLVNEPRKEEFHGEKNPDSRIFGNDFFVASMLEEADSKPSQKPDLSAVIEAIKEIYKIGDDELTGVRRDALTAEARALAAWATLELSSGRLTELAKYLNRDPSTLTSGVRRIEKLQQDPHILPKVTMIKKALGYQVIQS
jgi:putative transposase